MDLLIRKGSILLSNEGNQGTVLY